MWNLLLGEFWRFSFEGVAVREDWVALSRAFCLAGVEPKIVLLGTLMGRLARAEIVKRLREDKQSYLIQITESVGLSFITLVCLGWCGLVPDRFVM